MARYPKADTPDEPTPAPDAEQMSLDESAVTLRAFAMAFRGASRLGEAVEAARASRQQLRLLESQRATAQQELDALAQKRREADEGLELARQGLTGVQDATRLAREELETVRRQIADEKARATREQAETQKAWDQERRAFNKEIGDKKRELDKVKADIAEIVKPYAVPA